MFMKPVNTNTIIAIFLVLLVAIARIVNAYLLVPNMVPVAAVGLFSGAIITNRKSLAFLIPLLGQFLGDLYFQFFTQIPGFYGIVGMLCNYSALICATALGVTLSQPKPVKIAGYLLGASTAFFLVSNLGFFLQGWNGYSLSGLSKTYVDAIPFYKYSLLGDMVGGTLLFGGYFLAARFFAARAQKARIS